MIKCPHCKEEVDCWGELNTIASTWKLNNGIPEEINQDSPDNTVYFCPECIAIWEFSFTEILKMLNEGGESE